MRRSPSEEYALDRLYLVPTRVQRGSVNRRENWPDIALGALIVLLVVVITFQIHGRISANPNLSVTAATVMQTSTAPTSTTPAATTTRALLPPRPSPAKVTVAPTAKKKRVTPATHSAPPARVAPPPVLPKPVAPKPVAPKPVAPKPVAPKPVAPKPVAPKPVAPKPVARGPRGVVSLASSQRLPNSQQDQLDCDKLVVTLVNKSDTPTRTVTVTFATTYSLETNSVRGPSRRGPNVTATANVRILPGMARAVPMSACLNVQTPWVFGVPRTVRWTWAR